MKKTIISALAAIAILIGNVAPAFAAEPCNNTCQSIEQTQNGFQSIGQGISQAAEGSYNTVKNGTVNTYNKAKNGTVKAYDKTRNGARKAYRKTKKGVENAYDKTKNGVVNAYDKTKNGIESIFN